MSEKKYCEKITKTLVDIRNLSSNFDFGGLHHSGQLKEALAERRQIDKKIDESMLLLCEEIMPKDIEQIDLMTQDKSIEELKNEFLKHCTDIPKSLLGYLNLLLEHESYGSLKPEPKQLHLVVILKKNLFTPKEADSFVGYIKRRDKAFSIGLEALPLEAIFHLAIKHSYDSKDTRDYYLATNSELYDEKYSIRRAGQGFVSIDAHTIAELNSPERGPYVFKMPDNIRERVQVARTLRALSQDYRRLMDIWKETGCSPY
jgi:hypothetical protein